MKETGCIIKEPKFIDITAPKAVEILIRDDGKVIWVNVNGQCKLRCCRIVSLEVDDRRLDSCSVQS